MDKVLTAEEVAAVLAELVVLRDVVKSLRGGMESIMESADRGFTTPYFAMGVASSALERCSEGVVVARVGRPLYEVGE